MFVFYRTVVCFSHLPKIRKAGNSDKRKSHFRLGYAEPCPIFAVTNIGIIVVLSTEIFVVWNGVCSGLFYFWPYFVEKIFEFSFVFRYNVRGLLIRVRRQEGHAVVSDVYLFERKSRWGDAGRLSFDKMIAPCYFGSDFFPDDTLSGFLLMKSFQLL